MSALGKEAKGGLGGGLFGSESTLVEVNLNLTPLMDVMSNILFFLLAAFGSSIVAILPATVPIASGDGSTDVAKETDKVTVTVRLTSSSMTVSCANDVLVPAELRPLEFVVTRKTIAEDQTALTEGLRRIKERYPYSDTMVVVPDDDIPYQDVIRVMDAGRERRAGEERIPLFPDVVLAGLNKPVPAAPARKSRR